MTAFDDLESNDYWAIDDIETTLNALSTARTVTDRLGPEDPDEWGPGVDADRESE
jgi:hypothetical protein